MKILLLGYGPIARELCEKFHSADQTIQFNAISRFKNERKHVSEIRINSLNDSVKNLDFNTFDIVINSWRSIEDPEKSQKMLILQEISQSKKQPITFLNLSSVAVYGTTEKIVHEDSKLNPINKYGHDKLFIEETLNTIFNQNYINLRISNVFGHLEFSDFINTCIKSYLQKETLSITNPSDTFRDFIHIDSIVSMIFQLSYKNSIPLINKFQTFNLCSGISFSLAKIIDLFNTITHNELRYSTTIAPTNMILKSLIDNTKIRRTLEFNIENPQSALSGYINEATSRSL